MKKKIFVGEYVSGDKSFSAVLNILAYDTEDALDMGWNHFDHKDGNFKGYDRDASFIIMNQMPYKKGIQIDLR